MKMEFNKQESLNLEDEFVNILSVIRPIILSLENPEVSQLCHDWLEKLCNGNKDEIYVRNVYLREFHRQLKMGKLDKPFSKPPCEGALEPIYFTQLSTNDPLDSSSWSDITGYDDTISPRNLSCNCNTEIAQPKACSCFVALRKGEITRPTHDELHKLPDCAVRNIIKELQTKNEELSSELQQYRQFCPGCQNVCFCINNLMDHVKDLKEKVGNLQIAKEQQIVTADSYRKETTNTIDELKIKIENISNKCDEFENSVKKLESQVVKSNDNYGLWKNSMKNEVVNVVQAEATKYQDICSEVLKSHLNDVSYLLKAIDRLSEHVIKKNLQVSILKMTIKRIQTLRKTASKLCKEKLYNIKLDKENELKVLHALYETQKLESTTEISVGKQQALDDIVKDLENRYSTLVLDIKQKDSTERLNYIKKINELELKLGILKKD